MPDKYTKEAATALCSIWIPIGSIVNGVRNDRECDVYIEGNNRAVRLSRVVVADLLKQIDELEKTRDKVWNKEDIEIKPCPFCGKRIEVDLIIPEDNKK